MAEPNGASDERVFTVGEVAALFHVDESTVRRWDHELSPLRIPFGRRERRYPYAPVAAKYEEMYGEPLPEPSPA